MDTNAKAVVIREPSQATIVTPMEMLDRAISSGASIDVLEKLMGLQERYEANQSRKAFDEAIAEAKADITPITKNREGHNSKRYADFAAVARVVDPVISRHGLSYRFRTRQDDKIHVTCILSHRSGHSEETTLAGPADATGNKNAIQAIGSTLTYLQRYSLMQALGLAASEDDDGGGAAASSDLIDDQQAQWLKTSISFVGADEAKFLQFISKLAKAELARIEDIPARLYPQAMDMLNKKRAATAAAKKAEANAQDH